MPIVAPKVKVVRVNQAIPGPPGPAGGSFLAVSTARVDPSGDDSTGTVGDLTKPFLTVQAAVTALEGYTPPIGTNIMYPILDLGTNLFGEDVTTSLHELAIRSVQYNQQGGGISGTLTLTDTNPDIVLEDVLIDGDMVFSGSPSISIRNSWVNGNITAASGQSIIITGIQDIPWQSVGVGATVDAPGGAVDVTGPIWINKIGNSKSCNAQLINCQVGTVSVDALTIQDARPITDWSTWEWNSLTTTDKLLNPAWMDFSTLPQAISEPAIDVGKAWIDTTGGNNIVKVKL